MMHETMSLKKKTCFPTSHRKRIVPSCWPAGPRNMYAVLRVIATTLYKTADVIIPLHTLYIVCCESRIGKHYKSRSWGPILIF